MEESKRGKHRSSRRSFLKGVTAASVVALDTAAKSAIPVEGVAAVSIDEQQRGPGRRFIAIQVGGVSFVDEGVDPVLDNLQRAQVNALMLAVFTYGRGIAGRQVPGQPLAGSRCAEI